MDVKRIAPLVLLSISLVPGILSIRNFLRIKQNKSKLMVLEQSVTMESSVPSLPEIMSQRDIIRTAVEAELKRYTENPYTEFYEFAGMITNLADKLKLSIVNASANGSGTDRYWNITLSGTAVSLMNFLYELDNNNTYITYPAIVLQDAGIGMLEARISLKHPPPPQIDSSSPRTEPVSVPPLITRESSRNLAKIFSPEPFPAPPPRQTVISELKQTLHHIVFVGHYTDTEGNEIIVLKDEDTGRVRHLAIGKEVLGWTLMNIDTSTLNLRINEDTIITLEVP